MATQTLEQIEQRYEHEETRSLVTLVNDAAALIHTKGEAAFADFRTPGSLWRQAETYVFVLDTSGNMLVHPDPALEGSRQVGLKDVAGKPIIAGLLAAATAPGKSDGWYHYQWPVPGRLLPRWKSTYVRLAITRSGNRYVIGSGIYNDRMERAFVIDAVQTAVAEIERDGEAAYARFRDPTGPFIAKDAYLFVLDPDGVELVNPAFPNLEGRNLAGWRDVNGRQPIREMLDVAAKTGSGWIDYMWPKPGESVPTRKSAYVARATFAGKAVVVGCGVYLADAPKAAPVGRRPTASELIALVRGAAAIFEARGEQAYPEFREPGTKWFHDDTYFVVTAMDGTWMFHAAEPAREGENSAGLKDIVGRPMGRMVLDVAATPAGEGWVHYMYPQPGNIFPTWKSTFVKRVTFPSGKHYALVCGIYNMQMDKAMVEDVVNRAAALIGVRGRAAFGDLRDKKGSFVFMDTYVFVMAADGTELVNPAQPSLEGQNLMELKDLEGNPVARDEIAAATKHGSAWVDCSWFKPGTNTPARQQAFVRKVEAGDETFFVGSAVYLE